MAARPAALIQRFVGAALASAAFAFAQRIFRALARALISLRRCAADRRRLGDLAGAAASGGGRAAPPSASPAMASSWPSKDSICSLITIARRKSATERSDSVFIDGRMPTGSQVSRRRHLCDDAVFYEPERQAPQLLQAGAAEIDAQGLSGEVTLRRAPRPLAASTAQRSRPALRRESGRFLPHPPWRESLRYWKKLREAPGWAPLFTPVGKQDFSGASWPWLRRPV